MREQEFTEQYTPSRGLMAKNHMDREKKDHPKASKGRYEDNSMAHVASGEMVVPEPVLRNNPALKTAIMKDIAKYGVDPSKFMMDGQPTINPQTGLPEFGFFSKVFKRFKRVFKKVAPILAPIALGPAGLGLSGLALGASSAAVGALAGSLDGGGVKGALIGGATGGLAGGGASYLTGAAGLTGTAAKAASGALIGGAAGSQFGAKGALTGAALGGAAGFVSGGGLGHSAGTSLDKVSGVAGAQGPTQGSGLVGSITRSIPSGLGSSTSGPLKYASLASNAAKFLPSAEPTVNVGISDNRYDEDKPQGINDGQQNKDHLEQPVTIGAANDDLEQQQIATGNRRRYSGLTGNSYSGTRSLNF